MDFPVSVRDIFLFNSANPISFISGLFLVLFTIFILVYSFFYKNSVARKWLLIFISLFFYYKLTGVLFLVIFIPVVVDFFIARQLRVTKSEGRRKLWLYISVLISVGLLVYFKYTNFFIEIVNSIGGSSFSTLKILIPVGISYYIFRTISYVVDVYNEKMEAVSDLSDYLLYMTFFPLLISGPITRAELFLPQLNSDSSISKENINQGMYLVMKGIIKKAIIADYLGMYVNIVFSVHGGFTGFENLMGILGFAMQLYFDFSGYTDIAIGISTILGFKIGINFNQPFKASSITDFWRRWHISLSEWLRDYIFTPLNFYMRKLKIWGAIFAIIITFLLCGIWHGASFTFVLWGLCYGLAMAWEIATRNVIGALGKHVHKNIIRFFGWFFTFAFVVSMLVLLRADSVQAAWNIYAKLFTNMDLYYVAPFVRIRYLYVAVICTAFILVFMSHKIKEKISYYFVVSPLIVKIIVFFAVGIVFIEFQSQQIQSFLYTKF
ncbi:MAG: MBOAT family O-acyltransferase [Bacteroidota bacterium]